MINKGKKKISYLAMSFFNTLRHEGYKKTMKRFYYFSRYGKGVASKDDYESFRDAQKERPVQMGVIKEFFDSQNNKTIKQENIMIDIIIPVYNGFEYLGALFDSIIANTTYSSYNLIIVDDASPDDKIWSFLQKFKKENSNINIKLIQNEKNLGFVQTVNKAVSLSQNHFVLLNTDTEVPDGWLERLMQPILKSNKVASTTPMTNAGTIFSFPYFLEDNEIFGDLSVDIIDSYFKQVNIAQEIVVPTGMGFCMGFNKDIVAEIGMFDAETFGKGYGEENDWCQRAILAGYKNICVPNLFVYHKHGGSFPSVEKEKLIATNLSKLNDKHPTYDAQVQEYIKDDPLKEMRDFLIMMISANEIVSKEPVLFFDHELGGGANVYTDKFVKEKIEIGESVVVFSYSLAKQLFYVRYFFAEYEIAYEMEEKEELIWLLDKFAIGQIILSQIVSYEKPLNLLSFILDIKENNNSKLIFLVHDYFCVCPSYNLLNQNGEYCGIPQDITICERCLSVNKGQFKLYVKNTDIIQWRKEWFNFLIQTDEIICFSNSSKEIVLRAYPELDNEKIVIKQHKVDYIERLANIEKKQDKTKVIGVLGGINFVKGSKIVLEMVQIIEQENLDMHIVIIGDFSEKIVSDVLTVHGKYQQNEIVDLVEKYKIDIFIIPSIWPETFSYTTEEIMQMNMPLVVFDMGAPAERVKKYDKGIIVTEASAVSVINSIKKDTFTQLVRVRKNI
jgi:GT2 family glycosyltransferase/glycosyltransferase involved in cell wall biosynthesis